MITEHATDRLNGRLSDIDAKLDRKHLNMLCKRFKRGKHYIRVLDLNGWKMSGSSYGEHVTIVIQNGNVKTCMLSDRMQRWNDGTFHVFLQKG